MPIDLSYCSFPMRWKFMILCNPSLINTILQLYLLPPFYAQARNDMYIRKVKKDESYIVKSTCRICMDLLKDPTIMQSITHMSIICNLMILPWVQTFIWRLVHQCLPTCAKLITHKFVYFKIFFKNQVSNSYESYLVILGPSL